MAIRIKDWHTFQHFKDRRPPWIKLYREILDDYDIAMISDRSFRILVNLWLLASEDKTGEGNLPHLDAIAHRLRVKKDSLIKALDECEKFLIRDDINPISEGHQDDAPETETETETEKRQSREETEGDAREGADYSDSFLEFWECYPRKVGKKAAWNAWKRAKPDLLIVQGAIWKQEESEQWRKNNGQFIPNPATWLNQGRWDDEIEKPKPPPKRKYGMDDLSHV